MDQHKRQIEGYFDEIVRDYARLYDDAGGDPVRYPAGPVRLAKAVAMLRRHKPAGTVLDIGCGTGHTVLAMVQQGYEAIGIDLSLQMVEQSRSLIATRAAGSKARFEVGDVERMPLDDACADAVVALGLIEYLDDDRKLIGEIRRVLRPGGVAVIAYRNRLFNLFSLNDYTRREIEAGETGWLLDEYRHELAQAPPAQYGALIEGVSAQVSALKGRPKSAPPAVALKALPVSLRQHTPRQARDAFAAQGFACRETRYFHFHPFPPAFESHDPVAFNRLGLAMESMDTPAVGALMASAFLCVFQH
jgi:ubiquinone/menaquinone biosynthesis C-methylase UbiE